MGSIWAVARHTFAQCLRMKIAMVFILLPVIVLTLGAVFGWEFATRAGEFVRDWFRLIQM